MLLLYYYGPKSSSHGHSNLNPSILEFFPRTKKGMKPPWPDEHCEKANLLISIRVTEPDTGPDDEVMPKKTRMN